MKQPQSVRSFPLPPPIFAAEMAIVSPFLPHTMLNQQPTPLAIWKATTSPSSTIPITFKQHCCKYRNGRNRMSGLLFRFVLHVMHMQNKDGTNTLATDV